MLLWIPAKVRMAENILALWPTTTRITILLMMMMLLLNTTTTTAEEVSQCGRPGRPVNGTVSTSGRFYFPGERVAYKCLEGFVLFGDDERTCQKNGTWSAEVPLCDFNLARGKRTLQSATLWSYAPELAVDGNPDTCSFTPRVPDPRWWQVHLGHKFNVMSVGVTISPGSMQEFTIYVIELLTDNKALYKPCTTFKGVFQTHKAIFQCNDGLGHPGQFVYIRDDRKEQEYFGLCEVEVFAFRERIPCGEPEIPVEGEVERVNEGTAKYTCRQGFKLEGDSTLTCSSKGKWQGQAPKCKESQCGAPDHIAHGFVEVANHRGVYGYGTQATYNCSPGYVLQGNASRLCDHSGQWTGDVPTCKAVSCGAPPVFPNARHTLINGSTHWNGIAVYTCESGYKIHRDTGDTVTTCMGIGDWRFINVTCVPYEVITEGGRRGEGRSLDLGQPSTSQQNSQGLVVALAIVAGLLTAAMLVVGALLARRHIISRPGSMRSLVQSSPAGAKDNSLYKVGPAHSLENTRSTGTSGGNNGSNMSNGGIQGVKPSLYQQNLLANLPRRPQVAADQQSISSHFTSLAGSELDDDPNYARIPGQDPPYERVRNRSEHSYETLRKKSMVSELESEDSGSTKEIAYSGSVGYESVKEGKDKEGYETVKEKNHDYETVKHKEPGYETVKGQDQDHSYETVREPGEVGVQHGYETLKPRPPPPRIDSSSDNDGEEDEDVPDILQNLSSGEGSLPSSPVPPEILALYARVDKSKKRPRSVKINESDGFASPPQGASPTPPQSPLQSMSSTGSSASISDPQTDVSYISDITIPPAGTRDLIRKFSREDSENEQPRRPRSRQGSIASDTGTLRPLPPLPREHKHTLPDLPS